MDNSNAVAATSDWHQERYIEHARRLQTWIGAYGVGLAALLVTQMRTSLSELRIIDPDLHGEALVKAEVYVGLRAASMQSAFAEILIWIGVALGLQVGLLLLNKTTQLELAHPPTSPAARSVWARMSQRISDWAWIDLLVDLASIAMLGYATYLCVSEIVLFH